MRIKDYIQAAYEALKGGSDVHETLARLKAYLEQRGLGAAYPRVLRGLSEKLLRAERMSAPRVFVARASDAKHALTKAPHVDKDAIRIDPTIIGGFIIEQNGIRTDASYKRALLDAYRTLTQ